MDLSVERMKEIVRSNLLEWIECKRNGVEKERFGEGYNGEVVINEWREGIDVKRMLSFSRKLVGEVRSEELKRLIRFWVISDKGRIVLWNEYRRGGGRVEWVWRIEKDEGGEDGIVVDEESGDVWFVISGWLFERKGEENEWD